MNKGNRGILLTACAIVLGGCYTTSTMSAREGIARARARTIAVYMIGDSVVSLSNARISGDSIVGVAANGSSARIAIPVSEVTTVTTTSLSVGRSIGAVFLYGMAAFALLFTIAIFTGQGTVSFVP